MWTIGYINKILGNTVYITYTHVDCDIPFVLSASQQFKAKDIVAVKLEEKIIHGIAYYDIVAIHKFAQLDSSTEIHIFYEYQEYLINIANSRFDTNEFYKRLDELGISKLLYNYLDSILSSDFEFLDSYLEDIDIIRLIASREVNIIEYEYDKNGDYSYRCHIECTDYQDSYLNALLRIIGSYSSTCINNTPPRLPNETYQQTVDRIIKKTAKMAENQYSKDKHLQHLLYECKQIKSIYEIEKQKILELAEKYLCYSV